MVASRTDEMQAESRAIPERVGRYEVLLPIASGGMATVYLARSRGEAGFERYVAIKIAHPHLAESPEFSAELIEEAKLTVLIRHANVVSVIDADRDPVGVFLAMDYVEGDTLAGLTRRAGTLGGTMPAGAGLRILLDALAGLHAAHELRGMNQAPLALVHRDFSPQNILVGLDGVGRLADFGVAKAMSRVSHTTTGTVKGKIAYMSPEQARAETVDRRTDVWAAGVIAWELLAGRRLYTGDNDLSTLLRIVSQPPPLLRSVEPSVPAPLERAVASALTLDPAARCPTAGQLARAIFDACREARFPLADAGEVADLVGRLAGARLEQRRARVVEIVRERERQEQDRARAAALDEHDAETRTLPRLAPGEPTQTRTVGPTTRTVEAPTEKRRPPPAPVDPPEPWTASAVALPAGLRPRVPPRPIVIGVTAGVVAALVAVAALAMRDGPTGEPRAAAGAESATPTSPAAESAAPSATASAPPPATAPASASAPPIATTAVTAAPTTGAEPPRRTLPAAPRPAPKAPTPTVRFKDPG